MKGKKMRTVFDSFDNGALLIPGREKDFSSLAWNAHSKFQGVSLKHLVTSKETNGLFSYHLVRIDPGREIGEHAHDPQLETHEVIAGEGICRNGVNQYHYKPGVVSIFPPGIDHKVTAADSGLLLFAKFIPPLC